MCAAPQVYSNKEQDFAAEASSDLYSRKWLVNEAMVAALAVDAPHPEVKIKVGAGWGGASAGVGQRVQVQVGRQGAGGWELV